ncbi:MAG: GFA family protein, partial [Gluconacetobacter diazotrophicus]|nr:GFA family protein [Gluconacetobacter diazotrophicus]
PPANVHLMLDSKPDWVTVEGRPGDDRFPEYPALSLADWHEEHGAAAT